MECRDNSVVITGKYMYIYFKRGKALQRVFGGVPQV